MQPLVIEPKHSPMIEIDGNHLTFEDVIRVAQHNEPVMLSNSALDKVERSRKWVEQVLESGVVIYGINTGFGVFANKQITPDEIRELNRNLILSHAVGAGLPLPREVVRAALLIRANTLASGHSGIRKEVLAALLEMLNNQVTPEVPSQGSLGSSGDLAPLAHVALVLTTDEDDRDEESGWAYWKGQRMTGKAAMSSAGIARMILEAKEGLALTNGATFSAALGVLTLALAQVLLDTAEVTLSMSLEAMLGASAAFDSRLHTLRRHAGQLRVAERVLRLTRNSQLLDQANRVQDAYCLRCAPQVQGASYEAISHASGILENEINAVTDNPLLLGPGEALSGGNFHGEPVGMVLDYAKLALAELAAISERRIYHLIDSTQDFGLPPMLVERPESAGLHSGMMMPQYTAASLVLESQSLCFPNSAQSLPTSAGKEDHNANAMTAARTAFQVAQNCAHVLAIEALCAARALEFRLQQQPGVKLGEGVEIAFDRIRTRVPFVGPDKWWGPDIDIVKSMVVGSELRLAE